MAITEQAVDHYMPVAVETLLGAASADFDLFLHGAVGGRVLFRSRSVPLLDESLEQLIRGGVRTLLIDSCDREAYEEHLHARLSAGGELSPAGRYALLTGTARSVFESALRGDNLASMVHVAERFGAQLADLLAEGKPVLREMYELMLHDYYTFTHSANVATYSVSLARELGILDRGELAAIAAGGLLHDIGKRKISRQVLNTPGKLTSAQREVIQRHPQIGFEELARDPDLTWGQLMMVYQHHERFDGRGYPVGIIGDEIHPWAKICAVADVFDALTCDRPYRSATSIAAACEFLERRESSFDPEIVRCLKTMMQPA